jgi:magnesium-protoporphyrin O-methyltransferase
VACCDARGCNEFFTERSARRAADRYRKRGLDRKSRWIVEFLEKRGVRGTEVIEVGGGVGEIQIELLKTGVARTVGLELSPAYDEEARRLVQEAGLDGRAERRLQDIAREPTEVESAEAVVLHRVVCCYPDHEQLLAAAADHAQRLLVFSYPPRNIVSRALFAGMNFGFRWRGLEFRTFVHSPAEMLDVLAERGFRTTFRRRSLAWRVVGLER